MNAPSHPRSPHESAGVLPVLIRCIRDQHVILDADIAALYGVPTRRLNEQVKRNAARFPTDFLFRLTAEEWACARSRVAVSSSEDAGDKSDTANGSQNATGSQKHRDPRLLPLAFTEHGALMAATVLNSPQAVKMSLFIIRAFIKMREDQAANAALLKCLAEIDRTLLAHDVALQDIYQKLLPLLAPPPAPPKPEIGFHVKEAAVPYRAARPRR